jgi:hypothetical protein
MMRCQQGVATASGMHVAYARSTNRFLPNAGSFGAPHPTGCGSLPITAEHIADVSSRILAARGRMVPSENRPTVALFAPLP